jgi:hypothetical protein
MLLRSEERKTRKLIILEREVHDILRIDFGSRLKKEIQGWIRIF